MPFVRLDGRLWTHLWRALRGWFRRAFGTTRLPALPPAVGPASTPAPSTEPARDARPDTLPAAIVGRADAALDLPHTPVPDAPPPMLPPTALGACARATWTVRWRPPVLHVPCPRCQARLRLPLWKVLCYEDVFCEECALRLRRSTPAEPMHPRS